MAIGPDVANPAELKSEQLLVFRVDDISQIWAGQGVVLPRARWEIVLPRFQCVHGKVRKCRPFWWDIVAEVQPIATKGVKYSRALALRSQAISRISAASALGSRYYPWRCIPICEGRVQVYERQCCCDYVVLPDLIDRIREVLERVPIPWPPIPQPDPPPFRLHQQRITGKSASDLIRPDFDLSDAPPQRLYEAYRELMSLPPAEAQRYALERVWLHPFFCDCTIKKVGQVSIQPDGSFHLCYPRYRPPFGCHLTYSYKVQQFINGFWTTVYNGPAGGAWFSAGEEADLRVANPKAIPCDDLDNPPPPNETGLPIIMLSHIGAFGTFHFRYPSQIGFSQFAAVGGNDGLYTVGSVPDCPWAGTLGLFLHTSSDLQPIAKYYRLSVVPVNATGSPVGTPQALKTPISWAWKDSSISEGSDNLGPHTKGTESNLYWIPYGKAVDPLAYHDWLPGQAHQIWDTAHAPDGDLASSGRYMLILEVFDNNGVKVRPNNATPGPGTKKNFTFLRWEDATQTQPVPYSDCAHIFWTDQEPVIGDIVDLRKNGQGNIAECQYMNGDASDQFSIGYKAFHVNGISDSNSFMRWHSISWQRGLNGDTGTLAPETSPTTNAGEFGVAQSGSATFGEMLDEDENVKCTFSVTLDVVSKHFNGASFLYGQG
ncbi:MAG: hypothetical protein ACJ8E8_13495, partial [Sphingomicrobium sp.]